MYFSEGSVYVEDEDQCISCKHFNKGVSCPLITALGCGVVTMKDDIIVTNCGFYKEFKRHLKIVGDNNVKATN